MDNVCHTLVGAAIGEAGLKHTTRFGMPALLIASNLPDVDVLSFALDTPAVALRRGWTHGVVAQVALPLVFTGVLLLLDRLWKPSRPGPPARAAALAVVGYAGVLSHVALDWLNTYGVRLLKPLSETWFYGDAVFIVDPWLWLACGAGVFLSRRRRSWRPARIALVVSALYIGGMIVSARAARAIVWDAWVRERGTPPRALMVGPAPLDPLRKTVIVDGGDAYERGRFSWWPRTVVFDGRPVPKRASEPPAERAREDRDVRAILVWSRFPYYEIEHLPQGTRVTIADMRFGARLGTATVILR
jgi:inner membrane protein